MISRAVIALVRHESVAPPHAEEPVVVHRRVEPWLEPVLPRARHEVPDEIALPAAPRRLLHAVGVDVALPLHEARAVLCGEDHVFRAIRLRRLHPLVGVELLGVVATGIWRISAAEDPSSMSAHRLCTSVGSGSAPPAAAFAANAIPPGSAAYAPPAAIDPMKFLLVTFMFILYEAIHKPLFRGSCGSSLLV